MYILRYSKNTRSIPEEGINFTSLLFAIIRRYAAVTGSRLVFLRTTGTTYKPAVIQRPSVDGQSKCLCSQMASSGSKGE